MGAWIGTFHAALVEIMYFKDVCAVHLEGDLEGEFELAHISGPVMASQEVPRVRR